MRDALYVCWHQFDMNIQSPMCNAHTGTAAGRGFVIKACTPGLAHSIVQCNTPCLFPDVAALVIIWRAKAAISKEPSVQLHDILRQAHSTKHCVGE